FQVGPEAAGAGPGGGPWANMGHGLASRATSNRTATPRRGPTDDVIGLLPKAASGAGRRSAGRGSDYPLGGQVLDRLRRHPQEVAVGVLVPLAGAGRAGVGAPADVCRARAQLDRHLGDGPATDLGPRHLRQPLERRQLWIVVAAISRRLTDSG